MNTSNFKKLGTGGTYRDFLLAINYITTLASSVTETSGAGALVLYILATLELFNDKVLNHADFRATQLYSLRAAFRAFCLKNENKEDAMWINKTHDNLETPLTLPFSIMETTTLAEYTALIKSHTKKDASEKTKWL